MTKFVKLFISIGICFLPGIIGSQFGPSGGMGWYESLIKPALNPPNWVFGPVWTTLYLLMGVSLYLVWTADTEKTKVYAISIFIVQLVFNGLWSWLFFGEQLLWWSLVDIVCLLVAIILMIWRFYGISRVAALLNIPYLLWVSFATYLNFSLYFLNS